MTLLRDPARLRTRLDELGPRAANGEPAARRAAAEACVRLASLEPDPDVARLLARRAVALDPYRAGAWMLLARCDREVGAHALALERLEIAAVVGGEHPRLVLERARSTIGLARTERSPARGDAAYALVAPLVETSVEALVVAIEALAHGSAQAMREHVPSLLDRLAGVATSPDVERVLYMVVVSAGNDRAVLDAVERLATPGVAAAVRMKRATAQEACAQVADAMRVIADVRLVRLLLRERLATIDEPAQRRALFEQAIGDRPVGTVDGLAHDHLQLHHLVAKRALAIGDAGAARVAWEACLTRDPDNLAVLENLDRLGHASGRPDRTLEPRIRELRAIYTSYGPRPDVVLARAIAPLRERLAGELESALGVAAPKLAHVVELAEVLARTTALSRIASEVKVRRATPEQTLVTLLDLAVAGTELIAAATSVIAQPFAGELPLAYAYLDLPKTATDEAIAAASAGDDVPAAWQTRVAVETAVLLDPDRRAAYDARTVEAEVAEPARRHVRLVATLLDAAGRSAAVPGPEATGDPAGREPVVAMLRALVPPPLAPYLEIAMRVPPGSGDALANAILAAPLEQAGAELATGRADAALDILERCAAIGADSSVWHAVMAQAIAADTRTPIDPAFDTARTHARRASALANDAHPDVFVRSLASIEGRDEGRQLFACARASALLARDKARPALEALWWAYPDHPGRMPQTNPPVDAWRDREIAGGVRYQLTVARAMRQSTTTWNNSQRALMHTRFEELNLRRIVLLAHRLAYWWAMAGRAAASSPADVAQADALLKGLESDRRTGAEVAA